MINKKLAITGIIAAIGFTFPAHAGFFSAQNNPVEKVEIQSSAEVQTVRHTQKHIDEVKEARDRRIAERERRRKERAKRRQQRTFRGGGSF